MKHGYPVVHAMRDEHGLIEVRQDTAATRRTLHFGNDIEQSRYYLQAPFTLGFEYLETAFARLTQIRPAQLLTLGVGGGRLNTHLYHTQPDCHQTLVELRPAVIDIARQWFDLPDAPQRMHILTTDAFFYVQTLSAGQWPAIFVDVFDGEGMPAQFASDAFMVPLLDALAPRGRLLMNLWCNDDAVHYLLLPWLRRQPGFDMTLHTIRTSPNWILEVTRR